MTNQIAEHLAREYHKGQKYGDKDYFLYHLFGVRNSLITCGFKGDVLDVALLHDILEDTLCSVSTLREYFSDSVVEAVIAITKVGEDYDDYIAKVKSNELAWRVKIHDTMFNLEECINQDKRKRAEKYAMQLKILLEA